MSTFRERGKKKCILDKRLTITAKHNEMMKGFIDLRASVPSREIEIKLLKKKIRKLRKMRETEPGEYVIISGYINKLASLVEEKEKDLNKIKKKTEENDYLFKVLPILMEYSLLVETGKSNGKSRNDLWREYMEIVDPVFVRANLIYEDTICPNCEIDCYEDSEGTIICSMCGCVISDNIISDEVGYKDSDRYDQSQPFVYKRINHFNEWLSQFQAKETTDIPED